MSTENIVPGNHLPDDKPQCDPVDMENGKCIPDKVEHPSQRSNYIFLVSTVVVENMLCLEFLADVVLKYMPHLYSEETAKGTKTVSS